MTKETAAERGVREAWDFWLSQHPVSLGDLIEAAVKVAMREWLDAHGEEIVRDAVRHALVGLEVAADEAIQERSENEE